MKYVYKGFGEIMKLKVVFGAIIIATLWGLHLVDKRRAVETALNDAEKKHYAALVQKEKERVRIEGVLREQLLVANNQKEKEIEEITNQLNTTLDSLHNLRSKYESRPTPSVACPKPAVEFYREDAEFLAREAARAEQVLRERDFYYERYEETRKALGGQE